MSLLDEYLKQDEWRNWGPLLDRLPIQKNHKVFDFGCGPGLVTARLASRCESVIGVDKDSDLLDAAQNCLSKNCSFLKSDLSDLTASHLPMANGLWSSFTAAYFSDFSNILNHWKSFILPGGWFALIEIDKMFSGHQPLSEKTSKALVEYEELLKSKGLYDSNMGSRLSDMCQMAGLNVLNQTFWTDTELSFEGPAPDAIMQSWRNRFARMTGMRHHFGEEKYQNICNEFLDILSSPNHVSDARLCMVIAEKPIPDSLQNI